MSSTPSSGRKRLSLNFSRRFSRQSKNPPTDGHTPTQNATPTALNVASPPQNAATTFQSAPSPQGTAYAQQQQTLATPDNGAAPPQALAQPNATAPYQNTQAIPQNAAVTPQTAGTVPQYDGTPGTAPSELSPQLYGQRSSAYVQPPPQQSPSATAQTPTQGVSSPPRPSSEPQIRPPMTHRRFSSIHSVSSGFRLPDLPWLCGTWHVTHSTLPMWKNKRNVRIAYTRLPGNKLDDLVTYQNMNSKEIKTVQGIDTPKKDGAYLWRGKGVLKVASSKWEVLGWGGGGSAVGTSTIQMQDPASSSEDSEQWVVTYFAKTPFTPAGIDIYSRKSTGLSPTALEKVITALAKLDGRETKGAKPLNDLGRLVDQIFHVTSDDARAGLKE